MTSNPLNWKDDDQRFKISHAFRRLTGMGRTYAEEEDKIICYTPNSEYFICNQNGIIETYRAGIERQLFGPHSYVKVDNLFYAVSDFVDACKDVHLKVYKSRPPYFVVVSLIGVQGTYFASFKNRYTTTSPFPSKNGRFEAFEWLDLNTNIKPAIINGVHYGLKHSLPWTILK